LDYWTSTAKTLEQGCFDGLFIADALGVLDVYGGTAEQTLAHGVQTPTDDPLLTISAMAAVTRHLGFAVTVSTSYELPYAFARKMTTLDHLTKGRIGWNIVTSALDSAARNLGLTRQVPHDERYAIAEEFMQVVYQLWEASWQDDAVVADRRRGIFVDHRKVRRIAHAGKYFSVPDFALSEPSIQRTPALFQAGTSAAGRAFAARHAEGIFLSVPKAGMARGGERPGSRGSEIHCHGSRGGGALRRRGAAQTPRILELHKRRGASGASQRTVSVGSIVDRTRYASRVHRVRRDPQHARGVHASRPDPSVDPAADGRVAGFGGRRPDLRRVAGHGGG
jgi:hypothetical protein